MKTITLKNLKELRACGDGVDWFKAQNETAIDKVCLALCADNHEDWANWLIVRFMTRKQKLKYAIYAAEQVLEIFEKHPNDARPRQAIAAAKKVLKSNTKKNRDAAAAAAHAATHAATHAAAHAAVYAAAHAAAYDAAYAVYAAAYDAAYAAYAAAYDAAYTAAHAAAHAAARKEMYLKIIKYGLRIMREKRK